MTSVNIFRVAVIKTILINLKLSLKYGELRFNFLIARHCKIRLNGELEISRKARVLIGFGDVEILDESIQTKLVVKGKLLVNDGIIRLDKGTKVSVNRGGELIFNGKFHCTGDSSIVASKKVSFGRNVLISWKCLLSDTDFHKIIRDGEYVNRDRPILIGDNVWIGYNVIIWKGVIIGNNVVLAACSVITGSADLASNGIYSSPPQRKLSNLDTWKI